VILCVMTARLTRSTLFPYTTLFRSGNDGILRCCLFDNNQWIENLSSVLLGFKTLKVIASGYIDSEPRRMPQMNITYPKSFEIEEAWASGYPSNDSQLQEKIQCLGIS